MKLFFCWQPLPCAASTGPSVPRQQRSALLPSRRPRRSGKEVHRRQKHHPLPHAQGRHAHPARSPGAARRRQNSVYGSTELKYQRDTGGAVFIDFPQTLRAGQVYSIDFYYSGHPATTGRFGGITFKRSRRPPWINTACEGIGASIWWPNKDQWRDEVENMDISVDPQQPHRRLQRQVRRQDRSGRRLHALGLARLTTPSTTTTSR
jgi:hypothetical protein